MTDPVLQAAFHAALGAVIALRDAGRNAEAEAALLAAPAAAGTAEGLALRAHLQLLQGRTEAATATLEILDAEAAGSPAAERTRARVLLRQGRPAEAAAAARRAHQQAPDDEENLIVLASALLATGEAEPARALAEQAAGQRPQAPAAWFVLAQAAAAAGRRQEALGACDAALALRPDFPLWGLQGALRLGLRRWQAAAESFRRALAARPEDVTAMIGLGDSLMELADLAGGREMYEAVLAREPSLRNFLKARLILPPIPASREEIATERARYVQVIAEAQAWPGELSGTDFSLPSSWFYLAYQGQDDRPIMEALDRLFTARAPSASVRAPHLDGWSPPSGGARIKLGFISQFLGDHTIGRVYRGLIGRLDRRRFEVVIAHLPNARRGPGRDAIDAQADAVLELPMGLAAQQARLAAARFDILFYPDVGMASGSYWLARARMAPVQAVGWGHPDTTGLSTLDYYVSFAGAEPPDADVAYTERLVRLGRLPCHYPTPAAPPPLDRAALGLPETGTLYGCLQNLFKLHPDFDAVLAEIVARDPTGWLLFPQGSHPNWEQVLRRRWAARAPQVAERALFLPRRPVQEYLSLAAAMDVHLDPPHFGSGNTFYDAMASGAPVVTWPGGFARGRVVAGLYRQMGVGAELVVARLEDYAARAVAVAGDAAGRASLRTTLRAAAERELFADDRAVQGFAAFLEASVEAAGRGERLAAGWTPT